MNDAFQIVAMDEPDWATIGGGIHSFNTQRAGENNYKQFCFVLRGPDDESAGGIIGATYWDWFYLDLLWIREDLRGHGHGHRLLTTAEEEARRRGAKNAYLDTFSFQSPEFYAQHGYRVFGELQDFPPGHRRYFLTKEL